MRFIVCDDDNHYCQVVKKYILSHLDEESESVIETFTSANELVSFCSKNEPDILFMDIRLDNVNGI